MKTKGQIVRWDVEKVDSLCTLQAAFEQVEPSLGFSCILAVYYETGSYVLGYSVRFLVMSQMSVFWSRGLTCFVSPSIVPFFSLHMHACIYVVKFEMTTE